MVFGFWYDLVYAYLLWLTLLLPWLNYREMVVVVGNEAVVRLWKIKQYVNLQLSLLLLSPPPLAAALGLFTMDLDLRRVRVFFFFFFGRMLCLWVVGFSSNVLETLIETLAQIYIYIYRERERERERDGFKLHIF